MGKEIRANYDQIFLLPPNLEEWVPKDHPARFIRDFVDMLNLTELGFKIPEASEGRPPYAADLLLKVWLYGYMNRLRSTRKLETACYEHMSLIWLTGANYPDHNTLWRFWMNNKKALREMFRKVVYTACKADLVGLALHAVDGTKIAANVSRKKLWKRKELNKLLTELDTAIDEIMEEVERAEEAENGDYRLPDEIQDIEKRREKIKEALDELDKADRDYLHPHDPEARMMKSGDGLGMAFNAQAVVDEKSGLILAEDVVNEEADNGQLIPMVEATTQNTGLAAEETVADAGYYAPGQLAEAEERGLNVLVNLPQTRDKRWDKEDLSKSNFRYDDLHDVYMCPLGKELIYEKTTRESHGRYEVVVYRCYHGGSCPRRSECSCDKRGRVIERGEHEWAVERQRIKQGDKAKRRLLKKRGSIVEVAFGQIKEQEGFRHWSVRGLENARTQWSLMCTAFNLKKLYWYWIDEILVLT